MSKIPRPKITVQILEQAIEDNQEREHRAHLGGSAIGHSCSRQIYYSFRWYKKEKFHGRMLRLFDRGHGEEERFSRFFVEAGFKISHMKPDPQLRYSILGGHFSCEIDGIIEGLPEAPNKKHITEFKTCSNKSFLDLLSMTGKAYAEMRDKIPFQIDTKRNRKQHYVQMMTGMGMSGIDRALYFAVNKNDDCLAQERLRFSQKEYNDIVDKAESIIFTTFLPPRISERSSWYECSYCKFKDICHNEAVPEKNCRTCVHSEPLQKGGWICNKEGKELTDEMQRKEWGCHAYT